MAATVYNVDIVSGSIDIKTTRDGEFMSKVRVGVKEYLVITEQAGRKNIAITTNIFEGGENLSSQRHEYGSGEGVDDLEKHITDLMEKQHSQVLKVLATGRIEARTPEEYLDEVKKLLRRKNNKNALVLLREALEMYPDDALMRSYYGCLLAIVTKKYDDGVKECRSSIEKLKESRIEAAEKVFPTLYLNLARSFLASGKKAEAIAAINEGLAVDKKNSDLIWEMRKLGVRRKPVFSFLNRSSVLNKYVGMILYRINK